MKVARLNWFEQYFMAQISPKCRFKREHLGLYIRFFCNLVGLLPLPMNNTVPCWSHTLPRTIFTLLFILFYALQCDDVSTLYKILYPQQTNLDKDLLNFSFLSHIIFLFKKTVFLSRKASLQIKCTGIPQNDCKSHTTWTFTWTWSTKLLYNKFSSNTFFLIS